MKFYGLEKLSLVDYDGHTAATVFTGGCNFYCPYCHNGGLVKLDSTMIGLSEDYILGYLTKRKGLLDGLTVTGGEPTLHKSLPDFLAKVKAIGYDVKLDSNGTSPEMLDALIRDGLVDYIAMDIKNCPDKYPASVCRPDLRMAPIEKSVAMLKEKRVDYEFRTTVNNEQHSEEDFVKIAEWVKGADKYFIQKFRDADGCLQKGFTPVSEERARAFADILRPSVGTVALRGY